MQALTQRAKMHNNDIKQPALAASCTRLQCTHGACRLRWTPTPVLVTCIVLCRLLCDVRYRRC
jgi:hypothetical protein